MSTSVAKSQKSALVQQKHHGYHFGGPFGAFGISFGLPILCYSFQLLCNDVSGCPAPSLLQPRQLTLDKIKKDIDWQGWPTIINKEALYASLAWYGWNILLYTILPATVSKGTVLSSGGRLTYRFNAFSTAITTLAVLAAGTFAKGADFAVWTFISDNYVQLFTSNLIIAFVLAAYVYAVSFTVEFGVQNRELAPGGHSGNFLYDWFIGRELNPRIKFPLIPEIDIKMFMELRPGLLGWIVIDLAMIAQQYRNYGYVTDSILIITFAQAFYVLDGLYMEPAILTTIDCITDGFGFMLAFGDLAWLPFTYALQTRYLAVYPVHLGPWMGLTFGVLGIGYYIFRASNNEKNRFRTNPDDPAIAHLKYMTTSQGNKLLISGWWGTARHINYLGDWLMSWAYCLPTGIAGYEIVRHAVLPLTVPDGGKSMINQDKLTVVFPGDAKGWGMIVTYFFMLYFGVLLINREGRDEDKCKSKYGKDWADYCKRVPSRIIPYVY